MKAGIVGLGAMGAPIARHMLAAGIKVYVHDLNPTDIGTPVATAAQLPARAEAIFIFVPADDDVLAVCADLLPAARPGTIIAICSSVRPHTCRAVAEAAPPGVGVLDTALTGGVRGAEQGEINLLVGGDERALDRIRPLLSPWTAGIHHLGPLGTGQVAKTANNLIHWAQISVIAEAVRLARAYGLDAGSVRRALMDGPTDSRTLRELEQMHFTWWAKDIDNAQRMSADVGLHLRMAPAAHPHCR